MKKKPVIRNIPRSRDEELLDWIRRRHDGESANSIAKSVGINSGLVVAALNNVRSADLLESGENPHDVLRHYW